MTWKKKETERQRVETGKDKIKGEESLEDDDIYGVSDMEKTSRQALYMRNLVYLHSN